MSSISTDEKQDTPEDVLNGVRDALEERGFFHMANGRDIGLLLDELAKLRAEPEKDLRDPRGDPSCCDPADFGLVGAVARLERIETRPKPYDLYYAIKNEGEGTGWRYSVAGFGVTDLRKTVDEIAHLRMEVGRRFTVEEMQAVFAARNPGFQIVKTEETTIRPRFKHKKRGTTYVSIGRAEVQGSLVEGQIAQVYQAEHDGKLWARSSEEFHDGRFEACGIERTKEK